MLWPPNFLWLFSHALSLKWCKKNSPLTMLVFELQPIANDQFSRFLAFLLIFWQFFTFISKSNPVRSCFCGFLFFTHVFCVLLPKIIDVARCNWFLVQRLWLCCECTVVVLKESTPSCCENIFYYTKANICFTDFFCRSQETRKRK